MKVRDVIKEIEGLGWYYVRTVGDHRQYHHPTLRRTVTIPGHLGEDVRPKTLASIRRQARGR